MYRIEFIPFLESYIQSLNALLLYLHFDIRVRVAISIHGSQVNAAHDTHDEAVRLGVVHEGHQNPTALLHLSAIFPRLRRSRGGGGGKYSSVGFMIRFV